MAGRAASKKQTNDVVVYRQPIDGDEVSCLSFAQQRLEACSLLDTNISVN